MESESPKAQKGYIIRNKTFYRVWLSNEYCDTYPLFDRIEAGEFEIWLRENAEPTADFGKTYWFIDSRSAELIRDDIPYNGMGYLVKYEKVK